MKTAMQELHKHFIDEWSSPSDYWNPSKVIDKVESMIEKEKEQDLITFWNNKASEVMKGKTIIEARYLNDEEMDMMGWYKRPLCFFLNDGTSCILSMDDEGNDGGSLFYGKDGVLPTL